MPRSIQHFNGQDYNIIKKEYSENCSKFVDETFVIMETCAEIIDTSSCSLQFVRPHLIVNTPCLCHDDSSFTLNRGFVRNFNILLAFTAIKHNSKLLGQIIPDQKAQEWNPSNTGGHPGIFRFRFWQEGTTVEVIVDDLLPFAMNKCLSMTSTFIDEFWPSLLEKAYAKLLGGYDKLEYVRLEEILIDLTGGATECIYLGTSKFLTPTEQNKLYENLNGALSDKSLIIFTTNFYDSKKKIMKEKSNGSSTTAAEVIYSSTTASDDDDDDDEEKTGDSDTNQDCDNHFGAPCLNENIVNSKNGLCFNYGYLLMKLCPVPTDLSIFRAFKDVFRRESTIQARLLRLRCPLSIIKGGIGLGEWKGAFSISSLEWEAIDEDARQRLGLIFEHENDFWIPLEAALKHMSGVVICRLIDTSWFNVSGRTWYMDQHHGAWCGLQAGGDLKFRTTFLRNPQYAFDVSSDSKEDILLALVRKYNRDPYTNAIQQEVDKILMGLSLFKVENNRTVRLHNLAFSQLIHVEAARPYRVCLIRTTLLNGRYVIIPFLEKPSMTAAYLLRVYSRKRIESVELLMDLPPKPLMNFIHTTVKEIVRFQIHSAGNLLWPDGKTPPSPYCYITGEGVNIRTAVCKSNSNPVWDECFMLYRRNPRNIPLVIEIYDKRSFGFDVFLGRHSFKQILSTTVQECILFGRDTREERFQRVKGTLFVGFYVAHSEDYMFV